MADGTSSFWGSVTSASECCEKNCAYSPYIAEFYNTVSNILTILLAFIGLKNAVRQRQQQGDETPMVWEMLLYMYILYSSTFLFLYGAVFAVVHFVLCFGIGFKISSWPINPQGNALWHLLMGLNSYFANTILMFCRAQQRGWAP